MGTRMAYLTNEPPSSMSAFVHEEIALLRESGHDIAAFALRGPSWRNSNTRAGDLPPGCTFVFANPLDVAIGALRHCFAQPAASWRTLRMAASDLRHGRFEGRERPASMLTSLLAGLWLADRVRANAIDHLHAHLVDRPATVAMYAAAAAEITFSVTAHDTDLYREASLLDRKLERASLFTTVSSANRRYLLELLGAAATDVRVVHCGIDVGDFKPRPADSGTGSTVIFTAGPLVSRKGFDVLFQALALLRDAKPDLRVAIAGDGSQRERLEQLVAKLHVADRVSFLGDISRDDIKTHLTAAALFALPCREALSGDRDAIPLALIEAMACSVPVISTRLSGIPELVEHEQTGLLVDPEDPVDLGAAIVRLLGDQELRRRLQENARARIESDFNLARTAQQLAALIADVVARGREDVFPHETPVNVDGPQTSAAMQAPV